MTNHAVSALTSTTNGSTSVSSTGSLDLANRSTANVQTASFHGCAPTGTRRGLLRGRTDATACSSRAAPTSASSARCTTSLVLLTAPSVWGTSQSDVRFNQQGGQVQICICISGYSLQGFADGIPRLLRSVPPADGFDCGPEPRLRRGLACRRAPPCTPLGRRQRRRRTLSQALPKGQQK